jgi:GDP-mannose 6-dehydrogenase
MKISIFGLGYVGVISAGCLASKGHKIIGVDVIKSKVNLINKGHSPIIEKDIPELIKKASKDEYLSATTDAKTAIKNSEVSFICVGTPSSPNGSLELKHLESVTRDIGFALKEKKEFHCIVYRSTMLPGTIRKFMIPLLEKTSEKKLDKGFSLAYNPEFLRESTSVYDFFNPPMTIVGADNLQIANRVISLSEDLPGQKIKTSIEIAEMVKYVNNNFHALKITFANEIGQICKKMGLDSHKVMEIFSLDCQLNISKAYLSPGFAFGGSCLPKDLRAINHFAKLNDLDLPVLRSILSSNTQQIREVVKKILNLGKKKIGFAGFSFKAGTDDLRESPIVELIENLIGKGYDIKIYDRYVNTAKLIGANKEYINNVIPHISAIMVNSIDELIKDREIFVIGNRSEEFLKILNETSDQQIIIDLVRIKKEPISRKNYFGLYW